jgi:hypothetical protein
MKHSSKKEKTSKVNKKAKIQTPEEESVAFLNKIRDKPIITRDGFKLSANDDKIVIKKGSTMNLALSVTTKENAKPYKDARMRLFEDLDRIVNSDDMKLVMAHDGIKRDHDEPQILGLVFAARKNATMVDALLSTPPGFGALLYDRNQLSCYK